MIFSYNKFLRPITSSDNNVQVLNNDGVVIYTINPFSVGTTKVTNNLVQVSFKSGRTISIPFSSHNEAKLALVALRAHLDKLVEKTPSNVSVEIKNYVKEIVGNTQSFFYQVDVPTGSGTDAILPGTFWYDSDYGYLYVYVYDGTSYQWVYPTELSQTGDLIFSSNSINSLPGDDIFILPGTSSLIVGGDLLPTDDSLYNLGSTTSQWKSLYVSDTTIYVGGVTLSTADGSLQVNSLTLGSVDNPLLLSTDGNQLIINGATVSSGTSGTSGTSGSSGTSGTSGSSGSSGSSGTSAVDGSSGSSGSSGTSGSSGSSGTSGSSGSSGTSGSSGSSGTSGTSGSSGSSGINGGNAYAVSKYYYQSGNSGSTTGQFDVIGTANFNSITGIYINSTDYDGLGFGTYLQGILNSGKTIEMQIKKITDPTRYGIYRLDSATYSGGKLTSSSLTILSSSSNAFESGGAVTYHLSFIGTTPLTNLSITGNLDVSGTASFNGLTVLQEVTEVINSTPGATASTVVYDFSTGANWYHSSATTNYTANFTNVPTTDDRAITATIVINQGATAYIPTVVQISGVSQTIKWSGGTASGTSNQVDIVGFTFIRSGGAWAQVLGQINTFD